MRHPVFLIVIAQLFGTSLWFSANSAADDLIRSWGITPADIGTLTNAVQLGFIVGTLSLSISGLADRFLQVASLQSVPRLERYSTLHSLGFRSAWPVGYCCVSR